VGREVHCWVREPLDGRRELTGVLVAVTPESLTVEEAGSGPCAVPRRLLSKARLEPAVFKKRQGGS
jgi:ribosome maturation factor RimP